MIVLKCAKLIPQFNQHARLGLKSSPATESGQATGGLTMLMRLILLLVQLAVAWIGTKFLTPIIAPYLGSFGQLKVFVYAVIFAIIIFIIGFIASAAMRDVRSPTSGTLTFSLILALIGAGVTLVPQAMNAIPLKFDPLVLPLVGAALGYFVKR